jgi:hypothetical protein
VTGLARLIERFARVDQRLDDAIDGTAVAKVQTLATVAFVVTSQASPTPNHTSNAATMASNTLRIVFAVRRSLSTPRACQSRQRVSASGTTAA